MVTSIGGTPRLFLQEMKISMNALNALSARDAGISRTASVCLERGKPLGFNGVLYSWQDDATSANTFAQMEQTKT